LLKVGFCKAIQVDVLVAGDRIDTTPFNDGKEAAEALVDKEVVFNVG
jgi:hypothetical protein